MYNRKTSIILIGIILWSLISSVWGGAMGEKLDYKAEIKSRLKTINISDGVNREEAKILAQNYLIDNNLDNLLIISKPSIEFDRRRKDSWLITFPTTREVRLKQGLSWGSVLINKRTGEVKYLGEGPS